MSKKILLITASPVEQARLRLDKEAREIEEGLQRSQYRDQFQLIKREAAQIDDLRRALLDNQPQIVHFSGHGTGEDGLVFEDQQGKTQLLSTDALADLFKLFPGQIECVVLNACYSEAQAKTIVQHVGYVISMNKAIGDDAAIKFSIGFYDALGGGRSVEDAYWFGRNAIQSQDIPEHLTPVIDINSEWKPNPPKVVEALGSFSLRELIRNGILNELASVFNSKEQADLLLDSIDFPRHMRPIFPQSGTTLGYWREICQQIQNGTLPSGNNLQPLINAAAEIYPANPNFRKYSS